MLFGLAQIITFYLRSSPIGTLADMYAPISLCRIYLCMVCYNFVQTKISFDLPQCHILP